MPYTDAGKAAKRAIAQRVSGDFLALRDDDKDVVEFMPSIETEPVIEAVDAPETAETLEVSETTDTSETLDAPETEDAFEPAEDEQ